MSFDGKHFEENLMSFFQKHTESPSLSSLTLHQTFMAQKSSDDKKEL